MSYACYACHGLGVIQPIDEIAMELNAATPPGVHFNIVGGVDPRIEQGAIESRMAAIASTYEFIWIGHSLGAALGFYLPQKYPKWKFALVITVDPTDWGSNINSSPWITNPPHPGHWHASPNAKRWINIRSSQYPGGGILDGNSPAWEDHHFPELPHIGIILDPRVKKIIFDAVKGEVEGKKE